MKKNHKIIAGGSALVLALGLGLAGIASSSAYFSDTLTGGSVAVSLASFDLTIIDSEGNPVEGTPDIDLGELAPGEASSGSFTVSNTGTTAANVYLTFDDETVLKAINNLGQKASITITVDGETVFFSDNLNDDPEDQGSPGVQPLPEMIQLNTDGDPLKAGEEMVVEFTIELDESWTTEGKAGVQVKLPYSIEGTQQDVDLLP